MDNICPHHSGIQAELKSVCAKLDIRFTEINRRMDKIEDLFMRVGILEKGSNYREGSRHWTDYIITVIIAGAVVLLSKLVHL